MALCIINHLKYECVSGNVDDEHLTTHVEIPFKRLEHDQLKPGLARRPVPRYTTSNMSMLNDLQC